jgi:hypothetical protein
LKEESLRTQQTQPTHQSVLSFKKPSVTALIQNKGTVFLSPETRNSIDTEHIDRTSSILKHHKSLKQVTGMPGITNIHVNATLRLSSDKKSAQFDEADDSQESLKHQSKDVRAMIFDMRRKTFNAETNHYNYGNHVPQKNLLT